VYFATNTDTFIIIPTVVLLISVQAWAVTKNRITLLKSFRSSVAKARYQRSAWQVSRHRKTHVFANIVECWRVYCHEYKNFCHYIRRENITKNFEQKHSSAKISKFCSKSKVSEIVVASLKTTGKIDFWRYNGVLRCASLQIQTFLSLYPLWEY